MPRWNANPVTTAEVQAAQAAADAAQVTADAALPSVALAPFASVGQYGRLTHQPLEAGVLLTSTAEAGRIVYFPCCPTADVDVDQWAVEQTNTPVGTTLQVHVARYAVDPATNLPAALAADYTVTGAPVVLLNAAPTLVASATFAAPITIPAGRWWLAVLFLGAAGGTPPVLRTVSGHPGVGAGLLASLNVNGGLRSPDTTNAAFPGTADVNLADQGRGGVLLYGRRA